MIKHYAVILFLLLVAYPVFSQIKAGKGYFIDNDGVKTECYIRDADWVNNPTSFKYRLTDADPFAEAGIANVREFGTDQGPAYVRATVNVDESPVTLGLLSTVRNPEWAEKTVFLKTLVTGPAKLFLYRWSGISRFYYQKEGGSITPLIYKRYQDGNGNIMSNAAFRQELLNALPCADMQEGWVSRLNYTENDMVRAVKRYNACISPETAQETKAAQREVFRVKFTPGVDYNRMKASHFTRFSDGSDRHNMVSPRVGLELEYIFPFQRNKWALVGEPSVQYYETPVDLLGLKFNVDYWTVQLPVGLRYYMFLPGRSRIFVNAFAVPRLANWQTKESRREREMDMTSKPAFAAGAGVSHGRWSGELRYSFGGSFGSYMNIDVASNRLSLIVGYRLLGR